MQEDPGRLMGGCGGHGSWLLGDGMDSGDRDENKTVAVVSDR